MRLAIKQIKAMAEVIAEFPTALSVEVETTNLHNETTVSITHGEKTILVSATGQIADMSTFHRIK